MDKQNLLFVILSKAKYPKKYPKIQTQMCKILWIFRFLAKPQYDRGTAQTAIPSLRANERGVAIYVFFMDCHANASVFARNDKKSIHSKNTTPKTIPKTPPKSHKPLKPMREAQ